MDTNVCGGFMRRGMESFLWAVPRAMLHGYRSKDGSNTVCSLYSGEYMTPAAPHSACERCQQESPTAGPQRTTRDLGTSEYDAMILCAQVPQTREPSGSNLIASYGLGGIAIICHCNQHAENQELRCLLRSCEHSNFPDSIHSA